MATDELTRNFPVAASQTITAGMLIALDSSGYAIKAITANVRLIGVAGGSVTTNSDGMATSLNGVTVTATLARPYLAVIKRKTNVALTGWVDTTGGTYKTSIVPGDIVCVITHVAGTYDGQLVGIVTDEYATGGIGGTVIGRVASGSLTYDSSVSQSGTLYVDINVV